jgi:PPOX class probable F420-dependent enzyme
VLSDLALDETMLEVIATHREGVLATINRDGRPQLSNVLYTWDPHERTARISTTADRLKARNLLRDPRGCLYVAGAHFWAYVVADGEAEVVGPTTAAGDAAGHELLEVHSAFYGPRDPEPFFAEMIVARRLVVRFRISHTYGVLLEQPPGA